MEGSDTMPTYEYRCTSCKRKFEVFQKISEPPLEKCPHCGEKAKRLISQGAFSLKGSGWYKDGYSSSRISIKEEKKEKPEACKKCEKKPVCKQTAE